MVNKMSSGGGVEASEAEKTKKIRELNDKLRQTFQGGQVVATQSVAMLDDWTRFELCKRIRNFNNFHSGNDPYKEHDFGTVKLNGISYNWKIDYFDKNRQYHSPDETNPEVTIRVLTIMRVGED